MMTARELELWGGSMVGRVAAPVPALHDGQFCRWFPRVSECPRWDCTPGARSENQLTCAPPLGFRCARWSYIPGHHPTRVSASGSASGGVPLRPFYLSGILPFICVLSVCLAFAVLPLCLSFAGLIYFFVVVHVLLLVWELQKHFCSISGFFSF